MVIVPSIYFRCFYDDCVLLPDAFLLFCFYNIFVFVPTYWRIFIFFLFLCDIYFVARFGAHGHSLPIHPYTIKEIRVLGVFSKTVFMCTYVCVDKLFTIFANLGKYGLYYFSDEWILSIDISLSYYFHWLFVFSICLIIAFVYFFLFRVLLRRTFVSLLIDVSSNSRSNGWLLAVKCEMCCVMNMSKHGKWILLRSVFSLACFVSYCFVGCA